jgi:4-amino-4-deoxy-L-arabinose transferase-like glycosyltransferase
MTKEPGSTRFKQVILGYRGLVLRVFAILCLFLIGVMVYKHFFASFFLLGIERKVLFVLIPLGLITFALYFPYRWVTSKLKNLSPQWAFSALKAVSGWLGNIGARILFPILFVIFVMLIWVGALWEGNVAPCLGMNYLIPIIVIFGGLTLWLHRDKIDLGAKGEEAAGTYRAGWRYPLFLCLILLTCFGIRYYFASVGAGSIGNSSYDEGDGLYDANLILHGKTPFIDYSSREPGYLYTLALFIKIFGYQVMTGRLLAIIASVVICFFIFLIGKELYNRNVGLIAALIYCLSPFFIDSDIIGYLGTASLVWVPISVYFLILAVKRNKLKYYFLSGLFIGIAMLFYRGHLVYLILCPLVLVFIHPWEFKNLFRNTATVLLGFCLPVIPTLLYFVLRTDIQWMWFHYAPPAFITNMAATGTSGESIISYPLAKSRELYCLFRGALYLFIPALVFLMLLLRKFFKKQWQYTGFLILVWAFIVAFVIKGRFAEYYNWGLSEMPADYVPIFFCLLISMSVVGLLLLSTGKFNLKTNFKSANIFLILFLFCASVFFVISPVNSAIGAIPANMMAAIAISVIFQSRKIRRILSAMFFITLTLSTVFAGFVYANTQSPDLRGVKMATLIEVAAYIEQHTSPGEEIFTVIPAYAVQADRSIIFNISHPFTYVSSNDHPWGGYNPYGTTPSVSEIVEYMKSNKIKYIVWGRLAASIYGHHPELLDFVRTNYHAVLTFNDLDQTQILELNK